MRFCLSNRQRNSILEGADEIFCPYRDRKIVIELCHNYPNKTIIFEVPANILVEVDEIKKYVDAYPNLVFRLNGIYNYIHFQAANARYFFKYLPMNISEIHDLIEFSPEYIRLSPHLLFYGKELKQFLEKYNIKFRANITTDDSAPFLPVLNGINIGFIRPEDLYLYEDIISCVDLYGKNVPLTREARLLKIYKDEKEWNGDLRYLISALDCSIDNRYFDSTFGQRRFNCKQKCKNANALCHHCHIVYSTYKVIEENRKELKEKN